MIREVLSVKVGAWSCSVLEHEEGWDFAVCWRGEDRAVVIPSVVFETCDRRLFERRGLPKYVARKLASVCRTHRVLRAVRPA